MSAAPATVQSPRVSLPPHLRYPPKGTHKMAKEVCYYPVQFPGQHPLLEAVRGEVHEYRMQSPLRYMLYLNTTLCQLVEGTTKPPKITASSSHVFIRFDSLGSDSKIRQCRRTPSALLHDGSISTVQVQEDGEWILLPQFLSQTFPDVVYKVPQGIMRLWWSENGKTFNWNGLPTELKEHVVDYYKATIAEEESDYPRRRQRTTSKAAHDVIKLLNGAAPLLRASRQLRAITLRRHLVTNHGTPPTRGLSLVANTYMELQDSMTRLGKIYQCTDSDCVPVDEATRALAAKYKENPRSYPELSRFATFRHAIRRIAIAMNVNEYLGFFRMETAGYEWHSAGIDCSIFEKLPFLQEIVVFLPILGSGFLQSARQPRILFSRPDECVQLMHRQIYEQVATLLARFEDVKVFGFINEGEKSRFQKLLRNARDVSAPLRTPPADTSYQWVPLFEASGTVHGFKTPKCLCRRHVSQHKRYHERDLQAGSEYVGGIHGGPWGATLS